MTTIERSQLGDDKKLIVWSGGYVVQNDQFENFHDLLVNHPDDNFFPYDRDFFRIENPQLKLF